MARPGLTTHRKFRRLARALGSPIVARGALELMWEAAYESGEEYVGTAEDLAAAVGWSEDPMRLARALVDAGAPEGHGFIEPLPGDGPSRYRIHDLWHHAPDYVKKRRERELARQGRTAPDGDERRRVPTQQSGLPLTPSPAPSPARAPGEDAAEMAAPLPALVFPVTGPGEPTWPLTAALVAELQQDFPGVDIEAEARKARSWVLANTRNRKTAGGMRAFLTRWITKSVNRGEAALLSAPTGPMFAEQLGDWFDECERLHGGGCGGSMKHRIRMLIDAEKARAV